MSVSKSICYSFCSSAFKPLFAKHTYSCFRINFKVCFVPFFAEITLGVNCSNSCFIFIEGLHLNLFEKITATSSFSELAGFSSGLSPVARVYNSSGLPASVRPRPPSCRSEVSGLRAMMPPSGGATQTGTGHSYQTYQDFSYEEGGQGGQGAGMAAGGDPMPKLTSLPAAVDV